jgi:hypothetical protein
LRKRPPSSKPFADGTPFDARVWDAGERAVLDLGSSR